MLFMKKIESMLGRKQGYVRLLAILLIALSPVAYAGAGNASPRNLCDQALHEVNWRQGWAFKKYMKQGGDVAAWKAVRNNETKFLQRLISENPDLVDKPLLLMLAASDRNSEPLVMFLANGADPNARADAVPLLLYAVQCRRSENVTLLLAAGASVYLRDTLDSQNAMVMAMVGGATSPRENISPYIQGINLLLAAGYDPRCPVIRDMSPLQLAKQSAKLYPSAYGVVVKIFEHALMVTKAHSSGPSQCK